MRTLSRLRVVAVILLGMTIIVGGMRLILKLIRNRRSR